VLAARGTQGEEWLELGDGFEGAWRLFPAREQIIRMDLALGDTPLQIA